MDKKVKSPPYTLQELDILVESVSAHKDVLFGSFSNTITHDAKQKIWANITRKINAVAKCVITQVLVKK